MRKVSVIPTVTVGVLGVAFGILFALLAGVIFDVILIVCGIFTLLAGVPQFIEAVSELSQKKKIAALDFVMSVMTVAVGVMLIFYRNEIVMLLVGAYLIVFPLIRTLVSSNKLGQLATELPSMILGVVLMIVAPRAFIDVIGKIAGGVIIVLSIIYVVVGILAYLRAKKMLESSAPRVYVDTDGNGTVDTIYVDTTNDGVYDTEIKINEDGKAE